MEWISPKIIAGVGGLLLLALTALAGDRGFDERIPILRSGRVEVDIELEGGLAAEHGSLLIRSHEADELRVVAVLSGWGRWGVDLDLLPRPDGAKFVGRMDGTLPWLFGGPTTEITVSIPRGTALEVRLSGGPLVLEDVTGPVIARVDKSDVTLRRAEGSVSLTLSDGSARVEDVEGNLEVQSANGNVEVDGVRGSLTVHADHGSIDIDAVTGAVRVVSGGGRLHGHVGIESVTGPVTIEGGRGAIELEDIRGDIVITTDRGRIQAKEIEGSVVARSGRGGIQLEEIAGSVQAETGNGSIDVEFSTVPEGEIRTGRGSVSIRIPEGAPFDLAARTERGEIVVSGQDGDEAWRVSQEAGEDRRRSGRGAELVREINGGGATLEVQTERGSIHIDE